MSCPRCGADFVAGGGKGGRGPAPRSSAAISLQFGGKWRMERDMGLIRKILAEVRSWTDLARRPVEIDGYDDLIVNRHVEMLIHNGFLDGFCSEHIGDQSIHCNARDLTMDGHDFSAVLENETVWNKLKGSLSPAELASVPLKVIKDAGVALLGKYVMQQIGLSDG